jgi:hypothetical protein
LAARRLDDRLNANKPSLFTAKTALDEIYLTVLRSSIEGSDTAKEMNNRGCYVRGIFGSLATLYLSLSHTSLAKLRNIVENEVVRLLGRLHSILDVLTNSSEPIRLLLVSF